MTLNQFMRKIGYISEKNLVTVALEVYDKNCTEKSTDEKDFYFRSGNANAVGYICGRLGIDITKIVSSGDCNRCGKNKTCEYAPKPGQLVRYNCPLYKKVEDK